MNIKSEDIIIIKIEQIEDFTEWNKFLKDAEENCIVCILSSESPEYKDIEITCSIEDYMIMLPFLRETTQAENEMISVLKSVDELEDMIYED